MSSKDPIKINMGDTIDVGGILFVLTKLEQGIHDFPRVTFSHPLELYLVEKNKEKKQC